MVGLPDGSVSGARFPTGFFPAPISRRCGAIFPLLHRPLWLADGHIYSLYDKLLKKLAPCCMFTYLL